MRLDGEYWRISLSGTSLKLEMSAIDGTIELQIMGIIKSLIFLSKILRARSGSVLLYPAINSIVSSAEQNLRGRTAGR